MIKIISTSRINLYRTFQIFIQILIEIRITTLEKDNRIRFLR